MNSAILPQIETLDAPPIPMSINNDNIPVQSKTNLKVVFGAMTLSKEGAEGARVHNIEHVTGSSTFLGGPSTESSGTSNIGFKIFGGSPDHLTLMGESAGGGSVLHQLTAYGGKNTSVPFTQIITQSVGFVPAHSRSAREQTLQYVMSLANVSSVEELWQLPTDTMIAINNVAALALPQGAHLGVDGTFVLEPPGRVLLNGSASKVNALIGTNSHEGILFGDPRVNTTAAYADFVRTVVPGISNASAAYMEQTLYPPVFDGSLGYHNNFERAYMTCQEFVFTCNQPFVSEGLKDTTTDYQFAVSPGIHSQDLGYTFYSGHPIPASLSLLPPTTLTDFSSAKTLQTWIASFITLETPFELDG